MRPATLVPLLMLTLLGCDHKKNAPASSSASAAPSAAPAPAPPWYLGHWSGAYLASKQEMGEMVGPEVAWQEDEAGRCDRQGNDLLDVTKDRHVTGKASGPLGDMAARGTVDGDLFRIRLFPVKESVDGFTGIVIAHRQGEADTAEGKLHASNGNSQTVRDASVKLAKGDTPPAIKAERRSLPPTPTPARGYRSRRRPEVVIAQRPARPVRPVHRHAHAGHRALRRGPGRRASPRWRDPRTTCACSGWSDCTGRARPM